MKKIFILFLTVFLFTPTMVNAVSYQKECVGNNTIRTTAVRRICDEDGCFNMTVSEDDICEYGCIEEDNSARCERSPLMKYILTFVMILVMIGIVYFFVYRNKRGLIWKG